MSEPRTEAGRRLLEALPSEFPDLEWWTRWVLAIEREAAAMGRLTPEVQSSRDKACLGWRPEYPP